MSASSKRKKHKTQGQQPDHGGDSEYAATALLFRHRAQTMKTKHASTSAHAEARNPAPKK